jgi:hypothetical protein
MSVLALADDCLRRFAVPHATSAFDPIVAIRQRVNMGHARNF